MRFSTIRRFEPRDYNPAQDRLFDRIRHRISWRRQSTIEYGLAATKVSTFLADLSDRFCRANLANAIRWEPSLNMFSAQLVVIILASICPILLFVDGAISHGVLAGFAAVGISLAAFNLRAPEIRFLIRIIRATVILAVVPALWIGIQLLPLPQVANPIWPTAAAALERPLTGTISVDFGATVMALGAFFSAAGLVLLSAFVAVNPHRANALLWALIGSAAAVGLVCLAYDGARFLSTAHLPVRLQGPFFAIVSSLGFSRSEAVDCSTIGAIFATAALVRAFESKGQRRWTSSLLITLLLAALVTCLLAIGVDANRAVIFAVLYGTGAVVAVASIRRLGIGLWGRAAIVLFAFSTVILLVGGEPNIGTKGFALAFSTSTPSQISASQRALADAPWTGDGAGTFATMMPIYREFNQPAIQSAPNAVTAVAIELGLPMMFMLATMTIGVVFILLGAALQRGRDYLYPAAAAGCLISALFLSFANEGTLGVTFIILTAIALGSGFAQSKSPSKLRVNA